MLVSECCGAIPLTDTYEKMGKCSKCKEDTEFYEENAMYWTDEKVKEFCKIYTSGRYWDGYEGCKTIDQKLEQFKKLNTTTLDDCPF